MAENPYHYASQSEKDYKGHTICLLKELKYLDYQLIDKNMRDQASAKWAEVVGEYESKAAEEASKEKDVEIDADLVAAFIDVSDDMLNKIAAKDPQMRDLIYIKK